MHLRHYIKYISFIVISIAITSCGGGGYQKADLTSYVWPDKQSPKIKMINFVISDLDVRDVTSEEKLFGVDPTFFFGKPHGVAVDKFDNIYVTDTLRREVVIVNFQKKKLSSLPNPYGFITPLGIAVDNKHELIAVADGGSGRVILFDMRDHGIKHVIGQKGELKNPNGIAFDPERKLLYINDSRNHEVYSYNIEGEFISKIATPGYAPGEVYFPAQMATSKEGKLFVVDTMNFRVQIFDPEGKPPKAFGEHGDRPGMLARPKGIAVSNDGYIFVTDAAFGNFQIFDELGRVYLYVGSAGRALGHFNIPQGIFVDDNDKVYVVDSLNRRLMVFQYLSDRYTKSLAGEKPEEPKVIVTKPAEPEKALELEFKKEGAVDEEKPVDPLLLPVVPAPSEPSPDEQQPSVPPAQEQK